MNIWTHYSKTLLVVLIVTLVALAGCSNSNSSASRKATLLAAESKTVCQGIEFEGDYQWIELNGVATLQRTNDLLRVVKKEELSQFELHKIEREDAQNLNRFISRFAEISFIASEEFGCVMEVKTSTAQTLFTLDKQSLGKDLFLTVFNANEVSVILKKISQ